MLAGQKIAHVVCDGSAGRLSFGRERWNSDCAGVENYRNKAEINPAHWMWCRETLLLSLVAFLGICLFAEGVTGGFVADAETSELFWEL